jgi:Domain of unknown function (DUF4389)
MEAGSTAYPVQFAVEYPDRELDRIHTGFRIFAAIPILVIAAAVSGHQTTYAAGDHTWSLAAGAGGVLVLAPLLMIVVRQKYPRWWFDWNRELIKFQNRVCVYLALMDDHYPSTDEEQVVHLELPYPDVERDLNRWLPLVKWFLAIPHYIVLVFLWLGALLAVIAAWFAILFTGRYPRGLFDYVLGVLRWTNRVVGYAFALVTDQYPPFRLSP